jgi:protein-L-isoaspartate O-methyltransferase
VTSIERVPELAARARGTLAATGYDRIEVVVGDGSLGVPEKAPFHAIAVAAAAPRVPESLYGQLAQGGRLVVPIGTRADQRLVLASQLHPQMRPGEFCRRHGWSSEKYRKVAQRARARLRQLLQLDEASDFPRAGRAPK